jgi:cysteine desulfurase/selenocysteine lyase
LFDKSEALFPVRKDHIDLATCSIGAMYAPAAEAERELISAHSRRGMLLTEGYRGVLTRFRKHLAELLEADADDIAYVSNTAEGIGLIANGYPFEPGDQVIGYVHEFPSNHYPWVLQQERGVELVLLSDVDPDLGLPPGRPRAWSMGELADRVTERTRVVALSHVQFASGYAAGLEELGSFCRERGIDLVVDAAQSLGALPLRPAEHGIAAVVSSAWKWLLASRGAALVYLSPQLRSKLRTTMAGDGMMKHRLSYLKHDWDPMEGARRFEYSTLPWEHLVAIETVVEEVFLRYGIEAIRDELFRLQDILLEALDSEGIRPVLFSEPHRSGILSLLTKRDAAEIVADLRGEGIVATTQGGYVRIAPHFFIEDADMLQVAAVLNRIA